MIITNSSIGMDSARTYTSVSRDAITYERNVTTLSAKGFMDALNGAYENSDNKKADISDEIKKEKSKKDAGTLSDNSEGTLGFLNGKYSEIFTRDITKVTNVSDDTASTLRTMILKLILMLLIGRGDTQDMLNRAFSDEGVSEGELGSALSFTKVTHSLTYERYEAEFEGTTFNAKGVVNTKDGRQIDFGIDISMSRSFEQYVRETGVCETLNARLTDPLVINLDNCAADISDQKFLFDYLGMHHSYEAASRILQTAYMSVCNTVIIPLQDLLYLGSDCRMNTPGVAQGNWQWRMSGNCLTDELSKRIYRNTQVTGRLPAQPKLDK